MQSEIAALDQAVQTYLDGVHEGDAAKLRQAFHPLSHLYTVTPGKLVDYRAPDWIENFCSRPSPNAKGEPRGEGPGLVGAHACSPAIRPGVGNGPSWSGCAERIASRGATHISTQSSSS